MMTKEETQVLHSDIQAVKERIRNRASWPTRELVEILELMDRVLKGVQSD